jgi:hypothetical protein
MEEAPENGRESSRYAHADGMKGMNEGIEIKLTPVRANHLLVLYVKNNHLDYSSVLRFLSVEQKCVVLYLADVECLPVTEVVFCMRISCLFCVYHALSKGLLDSSTVGSFVRFLLHLRNWIYRLSFIIVISLHGLGLLTCSGIEASPCFPGASTIPSSSRFVVEGVFHEPDVVHSLKMVDSVLFVFGSHVLYSRDLQFFSYDFVSYFV